MENPFSKFVIVDSQNYVLHYVQGSLFWNKVEDFDSLVDCTKFSSKEGAERFIDRHGLQSYCTAEEIIIGFR